MVVEEAARQKLILTTNCARCVSINVDYDTGKAGLGECGNVLKKIDERSESSIKVLNTVLSLGGMGSWKGGGMSNNKGAVEQRITERTKFDKSAYDGWTV